MVEQLALNCSEGDCHKSGNITISTKHCRITRVYLCIVSSPGRINLNTTFSLSLFSFLSLIHSLNITDLPFSHYNQSRSRSKSVLNVYYTSIYRVFHAKTTQNFSDNFLFEISFQFLFQNATWKCDFTGNIL